MRRTRSRPSRPSFAPSLPHPCPFIPPPRLSMRALSRPPLLIWRQWIDGGGQDDSACGRAYPAEPDHQRAARVEQQVG
eukprot:9486828-Pyramimonas_sp.AAC.1